MPRVSIPRGQIGDGSLPSICLVCGADAPNRRFPGMSAPSLVWVFFAPLIGLLTFWGYTLIGASKGRPGGFPFCDLHLEYWPRRARFIVLGWLPFIAAVIAAVVLIPSSGRVVETEDPHWLVVIAGCCVLVWVLGFLPAFLIVHLRAMRPTGGDRETLVLSGVSSAFASALDRKAQIGKASPE